MLRDFFDDILSFIGSESLTDDEYQTIDNLAQEYSKAVYDGLKAIVQDRDGVSGQLQKLNSFFVAKGVDLSATPARDPLSQIFVGAPLDC